MIKRLVGLSLSATVLFSVLGTGQANAQPKIDGKAIVCGTFDQYGVSLKSVKWIGDYLTDEMDQTPSGATTLIQLSIINFCPKYSQDFEDLNSQVDRDQHPGNPLFN